jgi:hypothetical protein
MGHCCDNSTVGLEPSADELLRQTRHPSRGRPAARAAGAARQMTPPRGRSQRKEVPFKCESPITRGLPDPFAPAAPSRRGLFHSIVRINALLAVVRRCTFPSRLPAAGLFLFCSRWRATKGAGLAVSRGYNCFPAVAQSRDAWPAEPVASIIARILARARGGARWIGSTSRRASRSRTPGAPT